MGEVLLEAAAAKAAAEAWFCLGDPSAWHGQAMVGEDSLTPAATPGGQPTYCGRLVREVPTIGLAEIGRYAPKIDYVHMDIHGTEFIFFSVIWRSKSTEQYSKNAIHRWPQSNTVQCKLRLPIQKGLSTFRTTGFDLVELKIASSDSAENPGGAASGISARSVA